MNKLQEIQLGIAIEIKRICDKHNINYFLDAGSLLGAIRHKGFIPWDDDFDIGMLRADYEKFLNVALKELPNNLFLQTYQTDAYYGLPYAKVRMNNTVFLERISSESKAHCGIFVDIFPYDNYPNDKSFFFDKLKLNYYVNLMKVKNNIKPWKANGFDCFKYLKYFPFIIISNLYCRNSIYIKFYKVATRYNNSATTMVYLQESTNIGNKVFNRNLTVDLIEVRFENTNFKISKDYSLVLENCYGEYMKIPDESERKSTHEVVQILYNNEHM